ncbi:MAG: CCA tRNA nucleotidyltransferase [Chloroflexi bacterium]|nr:CCA tRNA nucleotidyltransferase [Chloroflexota bacterium]
MIETVNLRSEFERQLPADLVSLLQSAGKMAMDAGWRLYLVGGVVRDLLLERKTVDLDLVVEGDALDFAQRLGQITGGKVVAHSRFGMATLRWDDRRIDLATCRAEIYAKPGALPAVKPGSLADDLFRRDFTVNAMAVELSPERWGDLVDTHGGRADLSRRLIRVLHEKSFVDDATRIWRAIRYEQRLDFNIEAVTFSLLKRDLPYLETISGDRIRHELELVFREERPEKALRRAGELGVLGKLHPALKGNGWLERKFEEVRRLNVPESPPVALYLSLLAYRLGAAETESLIAYLRLPRSLSHALRDGVTLKASLGALSQPRLRPNRIFSLLNNRVPVAISALSIATDSEAVRDHIRDYLDRLRYVRSALTGEDLKRMGISAGPQIGGVLQKLLSARLDGKVKSREEEERLVKRLARRV